VRIALFCGTAVCILTKLILVKSKAKQCKIAKPIGHLYNTKALLALIDYPLKEYE